MRRLYNFAFAIDQDFARCSMHMNTSTLFSSLFAYKAWANQELFAAVMTLDETTQQAERHAATRILNHIATVDRIFVANLQGATHDFTATNTADTPSLADLRDAVQATDAWYQAYVETIAPAALDETIEFVFTDGQLAHMSRAEMLMHVITHGGYHRGAVGRVLVQLSVKPPRDTLTVFLHSTEPSRRERGTIR